MELERRQEQIEELFRRWELGKQVEERKLVQQRLEQVSHISLLQLELHAMVRDKRHMIHLDRLKEFVEHTNLDLTNHLDLRLQYIRARVLVLLEYTLQAVLA